MDRHASPFYQSLWALAAAAWLGTLVTDIVYWRTTDFIWVDASDWLVTLGVIVGVVALIAALVEIFAVSRRRAPSLGFALASACAWIAGLFNMLIHTRDSWTSVVPWGLGLSALTVLALVVAYAAARAQPRYVPAVLNPEIAR